jgi:hypothetical protein
MSFQPDFKHRLSASIQANDTLTVSDFSDSVFLMCDRATAILNILCLQFEREEAARCSSAINANALYAAINEIEDIAAITRAFHRQDSSQPQADVGGAA